MSINLGQIADISVDNRKVVNFQHWTIWEPPLKIKILKIGFVHAREDQTIDTNPKCHVPSPKMAKIRVDKRKGVYF